MTNATRILFFLGAAAAVGLPVWFGLVHFERIALKRNDCPAYRIDLPDGSENLVG